jgi:hypothetical protein
MTRRSKKKWTIADVAITTKGRVPTYSLYGYIVMEDGTVHSLLHKWFHGIALAILFPELAKEKGYKPPNDENDNVFEFQRFELDHHDKMPVIRVCPFRMMSPISVNKGDAPATDAQIEALRLIFKACGIGPRDSVNTDVGDRTALKTYEVLRKSRDEMWGVK